METGIRNGRVSSAQRRRKPCSPISIISSRSVIVLPLIDAIMPVSVSLRLRCESPNSTAIIFPFTVCGRSMRCPRLAFFTPNRAWQTIAPGA